MVPLLSNFLQRILGSIGYNVSCPDFIKKYLFQGKMGILRSFDLDPLFNRCFFLNTSNPLKNLKLLVRLGIYVLPLETGTIETKKHDWFNNSTCWNATSSSSSRDLDWFPKTEVTQKALKRLLMGPNWGFWFEEPYSLRIQICPKISGFPL